MKARTRSIVALMTFLFIGMIGYTGLLLYNLPTRIVSNLEGSRLEKLERIRKRVSSNRGVINKKADKEILREINEIANEPNTRESDERVKARNIALPVYYAFSGMLLVGVILMLIFLANSYKASADTVVYIDKDDDAEEGEAETHKDQGELSDIITLLESEQTEDAKELTLELLLTQVCKRLKAGTGAIYQARIKGNKREIFLNTSYAFVLPDSSELSYEFGEGLSGQVAKTGLGKILHPVPNGYIQVFSGLGEASPDYLVLLPIKHESEEVKGVLELALFSDLSDIDYKNLEKIATYISANMF